MEYSIKEIRKALEKAISDRYVEAYHNDLAVFEIWDNLKRYLRQERGKRK